MRALICRLLGLEPKRGAYGLIAEILDQDTSIRCPWCDVLDRENPHHAGDCELILSHVTDTKPLCGLKLAQ